VGNAGRFLSPPMKAVVLKNKSKQMDAVDIVKAYYNAFNRQDWEGMLSLLDEDIVHEPNQGTPRRGKALFREFLSKMDRAYYEELKDFIYYTNDSGNKVAVQFIVQGKYLRSEEGLPEAKGQNYVLPAAAFLVVENGFINKVTTYYNLNDWIEQVSR
jgi:steroid delta-isomerase-like uncharacterized protein